MFKISTLEFDSPFILAPMEAVNCASFRLVCKRRGAGIVFTDMIDADIFMEAVLEFGEDFAVKKYVNPQFDETPLCIQIGGGKISSLVDCAKIVSKYAQMIDYNVGCPLPYMLGKKGGVYLMKHPNILEKIIRALREAISIPFSVKIRAGWDFDSKNAVEVAILLESLGVDAITVHGRTRTQLYKERADWPLVRKIKESVNVPVILSGDVTNSYMAHMAFMHTKCDFIMCARGAMNNPSIFRQLNKYYNDWTLNKQEPEKPLTTYNKNKEDVVLDFSEFLSLYKERENRYKISEIRDHAIWAVREAKNNSELKQELIACEDETSILNVVKKCVY